MHKIDEFKEIPSLNDSTQFQANDETSSKLNEKFPTLRLSTGLLTMIPIEIILPNAGERKKCSSLAAQINCVLCV